MLKRSRFLVAAVMLGAGAGLGAAATPAAEAAGTSYEGCPYEYVCVYPENTGFNNGHYSLKWKTYGPHNLSNQVGFHIVLNNQSGGAAATLNTGYDGRSPVKRLAAHSWISMSLTPINSITLLRPGQ